MCFPGLYYHSLVHRKFTFGKTVFLAGMLWLTSGQTVLVAQTSPPLLPEKLHAWQRTAYRVAGARDLKTLAGDETELLLEYGSQRAATARYRNAEEGPWSVTVHQMADRSSAYGAYTFLRENGAAVSLGEAGAQNGERIVFYQGNFLVLADSSAGRLSLGTLADYLKNLAGPQSSLPALPEYLPVEGFVPRSDLYLLGPIALHLALPLAPGDWAGFAYGAETELARYRIRNKDVTLLLISYPTPQITSRQLREMENLFSLNGSENPSRPRAFVQRTGTLVVFIAGDIPSERAASLAGSIRFERDLAWSNPSKEATQSEMLEAIANVFVGAGFMMLLAFLVALAFAGFRLLVMWIWPGKVFNRPEETEIITLNLGKDQ